MTVQKVQDAASKYGGTAVVAGLVLAVLVQLGLIGPAAAAKDLAQQLEISGLKERLVKIEATLPMYGEANSANFDKLQSKMQTFNEEVLRRLARIEGQLDREAKH